MPDLKNVAPVLEEVVDAASDLEPGLRGVFGIGERHFEFKINYEGKILDRTTIVQCHTSVRCLSLAAVEVCGYLKL